ncbi:hypothetical protein C5S35_18065 [Candidatus Methanophagaceae archaeon]|nr:hypothetical protein C5S35_18065 [Methanophagales archaeon]
MSEEDKEKDTDYKHIKTEPKHLEAEPGGIELGTLEILHSGVPNTKKERIENR